MTKKKKTTRTKALSYKNWVSDENLTLVRGWASDGLNDIEISEKIGIATSTLYDWKKMHPEFLEAIKKGKEVADYEVQNALYKRAIGYQYTEKTTFVSKDKDKEVRKITETVKEIPPDTGAAMAWLKNRRPDKWRDRDSFDPNEDLRKEIEKAWQNRNNE